MSLIVKARRVIDGSGAAPRDLAAVVVEDGRVSEIIDQSSLGEVTAHEVLDLEDATLLPGFVDTHTHIAGAGTEQAPILLRTEGLEQLLLRGADNARRALRVGVTTLRDLGTRNDVIFPLRAAVEAGITPGPRMLVAGAVLTTTGGHVYFMGREVDNEDEIRVAVREQVKLGADVIKIMVSGGLMTQTKPKTLQFKPHELRAAVTEGRRLDRRVAAHCLSTEAIEASVEAGVNTIEHCAFYTPVGIVHDDELAARIADSDIFVNPSHAFAYGAIREGRAAEQPVGGSRELSGLREDRVKSWRRLWEQGVKLAPGTDAGWYATPFDNYSLVPRLMVSELGMSPMDAIVACTSRAAQAIGMEQEVGTIERGKSADLVALAADPLQDINATAQVTITMLRGEIVYQGRRRRALS